MQNYNLFLTSFKYSSVTERITYDVNFDVDLEKQTSNLNSSDMMTYTVHEVISICLSWRCKGKKKKGLRSVLMHANLCQMLSHWWHWKNGVGFMLNLASWKDEESLARSLFFLFYAVTYPIQEPFPPVSPLYCATQMWFEFSWPNRVPEILERRRIPATWTKDRG